MERDLRYISANSHLLGLLKSTSPAATGVYLFNLARPTWAETEGATASYETDPNAVLPVAWIGPAAPPANRPVILHPVGSRYVAGAFPSSIAPAQCGLIRFTVRGCNPTARFLQGATCTVYDGSNNTFPILSIGTTSAGGVADVSIFSAKTYYYEISKNRFITSTGTIAASCTGSTINPVSRNLATNTTNYICAWAVCSDPSPTTVYVYDPARSVMVPMVWGAAGLGGIWFAEQNYNTTVYDSSCANPVSGTAKLRYRLIPSNPSSVPRLTLQIEALECFSFVDNKYHPSAVSPNFESVNNIIDLPNPGCVPIAASIPLNFSASSLPVLQAIYGTGTQNFTVSE